MTSTVSGSVSEATWMSHGADRPARPRPYSAGRPSSIWRSDLPRQARLAGRSSCSCRGFAGHGGRARRGSSGQGAVRLGG